MQLLIKTLSGLEPVLEKELYKLGATGVKPVTRGFICDGDLKLMYQANYLLRTALRILVPITHFRARNEHELYEGVRSIDWSQYLQVNQTMAVDAVVRSEFFNHSQYVALKTKDAVVDQFRDNTNRRPNVQTNAPNLLIHIHILDDLVNVALDTSGGSLHRRGYRREQVEAPINEVLAAGMLQLAGWTGDTTFFDPMCGSGTLPIEAAMRAMHIPAQYVRPSLGFQKWFDFDKKLWAEVKGDADSKILAMPPAPIIASDRDPQARNITSVNMMAAGMTNQIAVQKANFDTAPVPEPAGVLMFNPPYDERMQEDDIVATYRAYGDVLKQRYDGWEAWIISSNRFAIKNIGLRPEKKITVFNGPLECSFQKFGMWKTELITN
jgi:putative N6-adenine-specific DNA methylase